MAGKMPDDGIKIGRSRRRGHQHRSQLDNIIIVGQQFDLTHRVLKPFKFGIKQIARCSHSARVRTR